MRSESRVARDHTTSRERVKETSEGKHAGRGRKLKEISLKERKLSRLLMYDFHIIRLYLSRIYIRIHDIIALCRKE